MMGSKAEAGIIKNLLYERKTSFQLGEKHSLIPYIFRDTAYTKTTNHHLSFS
jgi:hypothetical protein